MKHRYVFYIFPESNEKHGHFLFFSRVKDGKEYCMCRQKEYDYRQLY